MKSEYCLAWYLPLFLLVQITFTDSEFNLFFPFPLVAIKRTACVYILNLSRLNEQRKYIMRVPWLRDRAAYILCTRLIAI